MSQLAESGSQPGDWEELDTVCVGLKPRGFMRMAGRSRMNREVHVRLCEGLGVKFPRATRLTPFQKAITTTISCSNPKK
jgi:hypothetical protein